MRYKADLTAGSLKVPESRIIADKQVDRQGWQKAIVDQCASGSQSGNGDSSYGLIKGRLQLMDAELWKLVRDGTGLIATHMRSWPLR